MFFTATSPSRYERLKDRLLGVLQRHGGADGNPNPNPHFLKTAISPFAPIALGPG